MDKRHYLTAPCPTCSVDLPLILSAGSDQGRWDDVEIDQADRACACESDDDALRAAVRRAQREAA